MQPLDQDSLLLDQGNFVYIKVTLSTPPLRLASKDDLLNLFQVGGVSALVKVTNINLPILDNSIALLGQETVELVLQMQAASSGSALVQYLQGLFMGAQTLAGIQINGYTLEDGEYLEPGDTNPINSAQVIAQDGKSFGGTNPNQPSFLCKNLGIGCSGGFNVSTVLIFIAVAIGLVAVAYSAKTVKMLAPA